MTDSSYQRLEDEDALHQGLDGFEPRPSRQLRDHLAAGGTMSAWLADRLTPEALERSRIGGLEFAARLDAMFEGRPFSMITDRPAAIREAA